MVKNAFSINFNAQLANGMTHFNLAVHSGKLVKSSRRYAWLLDNLEYLEVDPYFLKMHFCKSLEAQFFFIHTTISNYIRFQSSVRLMEVFIAFGCLQRS